MYYREMKQRLNRRDMYENQGKCQQCKIKEAIDKQNMNVLYLYLGYIRNFKRHFFKIMLQI